MTPVGFSHSEISGSKPVCDSPELIAANYVLLRHLTPRHPSCALSSLTTNLGWMVCATINYRDTPSQASIPEGSETPTPGRSCGGSDGCSSKSRSKLVKRAANSGFHRRSFSISQDTLSRRRLAIHLSKIVRILSNPDPHPSFRSACVSLRSSLFRFGGA
jgi:hypothetical protein